MNKTKSQDLIEVIIIGAGHSGISLSYYLQKHAISHIILEVDIPFSKWHQRWDGFRMNTVNWMNQLPGMVYSKSTNVANSELSSKKQILVQFSTWLDLVNPDIRLSETVEHLCREKNTWLIKTSSNQFRSKIVVMANGYTHCYIPELKNKIPKYIL